MISHMQRCLILIAALALSSTPGWTNELADRCRNILIGILESENGWVKVHAAEALIENGDKKIVREVFLKEEREGNWAPQPRVGLWRVLAMAAENPQSAGEWVLRIRQTSEDVHSSARIHAIESLCKLGVKIDDDKVVSTEAWAAKLSEADALFVLWALWLSGSEKAACEVAKSLSSEVDTARLRAAYILRKSGTRDAKIAESVLRAAEREPADSLAYPYLAGAAYALAESSEEGEIWRKKLYDIAKTGTPGARFAACQCLLGSSVDEGIMISLLDSPESDVRIGGAQVILSSLKGNKTSQ